MQDSSQGGWHSRGLPIQRQVYAVTGVGAAALLIVILYVALSRGDGLSQTSPQNPKLPRFIPTSQQSASFNVQTVMLRTFHTEVVTDGYVAPNGGLSAAGFSSNAPIEHGFPVLNSQSSDVLQAESDLVTASAQFRAAQANEQRQHKLYETDGAALKDWQQSQVELAGASASLALARSRLRILGKTDAAATTFAGETSSARKVGNVPSGTVFSVGDSSTVWLIANVRESDAALVHLGDPIQVRIPAYPNELFQAKLGYVAPVIDPVTHRLVVGAKIRNVGDRLKPNMLATFIVTAGEATAAPAVSRNAIVYEGDLARIWVASRDGSLSLREITVGRTNGDYVEVTKGLSAGERIVTTGALFIDQAAQNG